MNAFYLKYLLWIPPAHYLNIARIMLHAVSGSVAVRETYQYFTDRKCKRFGTQAWLVIAIITLEALICVKFRAGEFPDPAPPRVVTFWKYFIALLVAFPLWQFWFRHKLLGPVPNQESRKDQ